MIHIRLRLAQIMLVHSNGNVPPNSTSQDTDATLQNIHIGDGSGLKMLPSCPHKSTFKSARLEKLSAIQAVFCMYGGLRFTCRNVYIRFLSLPKPHFDTFFFKQQRLDSDSTYTHTVCANNSTTVNVSIISSPS